MNIVGSKKLEQLGSAIFAEIAGWKEEVRRRGLEIIDLGIGSPDRPPSERIIHALRDAVTKPENYSYPSSEGSKRFRSAVARWYKHRFAVDVDSDSEVLTLMGSQDGLAHLALSLINPGDTVIVPNPGYPIYAASLVLAGAVPYTVPLRPGNDYLPELDKIPVNIAKQAKLMILNYPSNPLSAVADRDFFECAVAFARKHEIIIAHDLAYSEMAFDGWQPLSILEVEGAKEVAVEFHSLSKSFNMAGCRIGFLVGNHTVIKALRTLKANIDYGVFLAVQEAGIAALEEDMESSQSVAAIYQRRRDIVIEGLKNVGWSITAPKATMFIWAPIPKGWSSRQISREILFSAGVVVIPGDAFGSEGEGFVRIALVQEEEKLLEAVKKIGQFLESQSRK
jgi:LL-diaminopimelate aminotransferase